MELIVGGNWNQFCVLELMLSILNAVPVLFVASYSSLCWYYVLLCTVSLEHYASRLWCRYVVFSCVERPSSIAILL